MEFEDRTEVRYAVYCIFIFVYTFDIFSGCSAVWISALEWGSRGRGFESRHPEFITYARADLNCRPAV